MILSADAKRSLNLGSKSTGFTRDKSKWFLWFILSRINNGFRLMSFKIIRKTKLQKKFNSRSTAVGMNIWICDFQHFLPANEWKNPLRWIKSIRSTTAQTQTQTLSVNKPSGDKTASLRCESIWWLICAEKVPSDIVNANAESPVSEWNLCRFRLLLW